MECKGGLMELCMRGSGRIIKLKARANSCILTVISMKENGPVIKPTAMEYISTQMELDILATGKMTYSMDSA